jgi:hypothetical protein
MRQLILGMVLWLLPIALQAQDSIQTEIVAKGVRHIRYLKTGPFDVHVLEIALHEPSIELESFRSPGLVKTSYQSAMNSTMGRKVIAAINADFFSFKTGFPVGNHVAKGKFVVGVASQRSHIALDAGKRPFIERFRFKGLILDKHRNSYPLASVNQLYFGDSASFFTSYWIDSVNANAARSNVVLKLINDTWSVGDTMRFVVEQSTYPPYGYLSDRQAIVSLQSGKAGREFVANISVGDSLAAILDLFPTIPALTHVLGGGGRLLLDGKAMTMHNVDYDKLPSDFITKRHPRTFVGFNRDSTLLYLCTVDGRQISSLGMNFEEMAELCLSLGMWNAVNLDGGGSTTMVVLGRIVNSPSDKTGERAVANTLQVIQKQ